MTEIINIILESVERLLHVSSVVMINEVIGLFLNNDLGSVEVQHRRAGFDKSVSDGTDFPASCVASA